LPSIHCAWIDRLASRPRGSAGVVANLASRQEEAERSNFCIGDGVQLGVHTPFGASDEASKAPFQPAAGRSAVRLKIGRVDYDRLRRAARGCQFFHYADKDTQLAHYF